MGLKTKILLKQLKPQLSWILWIHQFGTKLILQMKTVNFKNWEKGFRETESVQENI